MSQYDEGACQTKMKISASS